MRLRGIVANVVDGDTLVLRSPAAGADRVRLVSIDAPELPQDPYGHESRRLLEHLAPPGTRVLLETSGGLDKYGRLLAHIFRGRTHLNREMVREGLAVAYFIYPNLKYFQLFRVDQRAARRSGKQIWDLHSPLLEFPFEYRLRTQHRQPDKWVGDYYSRRYVAPAAYGQVLMDNRVFFLTEADARSAGYIHQKSA